MLIGHSRPTITWSIDVSGGATVLGNLDLIDDNRPDTVAAFTWRTGVQTLLSTFKLRGLLAAPMVPRIVGLSNVMLPPGTLMKVAFHRPTDGAGYPYGGTMLTASQRIFAGPHGQRTSFMLATPGMDAIDGIEFQLYNDVDGAISIPAGYEFTIGEAVVRAGDDLVINKGWSLDWSDPPIPNNSGSKQGYPGYVETPWRTFIATLPPKRQETFFGDPANLGARDLEELFAKIDRDQPAVYVPRYVDASRAFSAQMLHRTAFIGVATKIPGFTQRAGTLFDGNQLQAVEYPIPV